MEPGRLLPGVSPEHLGVRIGVGEVHDSSGVTVLIPPPGTTVGVDSRGGGPATHETDIARPGTCPLGLTLLSSPVAAHWVWLPHAVCRTVWLKPASAHPLPVFGYPLFLRPRFSTSAAGRVTAVARIIAAASQLPATGTGPLFMRLGTTSPKNPASVLSAGRQVPVQQRGLVADSPEAEWASLRSAPRPGLGSVPS